MRRFKLATALVASVALVAACGDDDDDAEDTAPASADVTTSAPAEGPESTTGTSASDGGTPSTDGSGGDVAASEAIVEAATSGVVWSESDDGSSAIEPITGWAGPESTPAPPAEMHVVNIICCPIDSADAWVAALDSAYQELGWTSETIRADGTPQGWASSFDSAIEQDPDAIIGLAIADEAIGPQLARAAEAGIHTIGVAVEPNNPTDSYSGYVSSRTPLIWQLMAHKIIADSDGEANVLLVSDSAFPNVAEAQEQFKAVVDACADCNIAVETINWTINDGLDPVKSASIIDAALRSNADATHLVLPYSIGLASSVEAIRSAGKTDSVKVLTVAADGTSFPLVRAGSVEAAVSVDNTWIMWASVDQLIRVAGGEAADPDGLGVGIHIYTAADAPEDPDESVLSEYVDYRAEYRTQWGL